MTPPAAPSPRPRRGRRRAWLRRGLLAFSALAGLYAGLVVAVAYLALHPPHRSVSDAPAASFPRRESVTFPSAAPDALALRGWLFPAAGKPRGLVVYCHGRDGNRSAVLPYVPFLRRAGFSVLSFDFRGYGDAGGMSTIGYQEVGDARGALRFVRSRPDLRRLPVALYGHSMGAAVAIRAAAVEPGVRCVVADSAYASLDRAVDQRFRGVFGPSAPLVGGPVQWVGEQMMGASTASVSPLAVVDKIAPRALLLIHGTDDRLIRPDDSRRLFAAAKGPKELWLVPGAGHVRAHATAGGAYEERVAGFLARGLAAKGR